MIPPHDNNDHCDSDQLIPNYGNIVSKSMKISDSVVGSNDDEHNKIEDLNPEDHIDGKILIVEDRDSEYEERLVEKIDDGVDKHHIVKLEGHEFLVFDIVLREKKIPIEHKRYHTEEHHKSNDAKNDIHRIRNALAYDCMVAKLDAEREDNFEHRKENCYYENSAEHKRDSLINFFHFLPYF